MPSTTTLPLSRTRPILPRRPLSRPVNTTTSSPLRILFMAFSGKLSEPLQHFGSQRDDAHETIAQLAGDRPKDTGADRLHLIGQQHGGIGVEADQRTVRATHALLGAHDDGVMHFALLDLATGDGVLDGDLDDVTDVG